MHDREDHGGTRKLRVSDSHTVYSGPWRTICGLKVAGSFSFRGWGLGFGV